jgi:hypothetical protein
MNKKYDNNNIIIASRAYFLQVSEIDIAEGTTNDIRKFTTSGTYTAADAYEALFHGHYKFLPGGGGVGELLGPSKMQAIRLAHPRRPRVDS